VYVVLENCGSPVCNRVNTSVAHLRNNCAIVIYKWLKLTNLSVNLEISNSCHFFPLSLELDKSLSAATDIFGIRQKFVLRRKKVDTRFRTKKKLRQKKSPNSGSLSRIIGGNFLGYTQSIHKGFFDNFRIISFISLSAQ
jgi:hypothetical protein